MSDSTSYARDAAFDLINAGGEWLVLLLHGLGGDRRQALGLVDGLALPNLTILAPDLRAHGETPTIGPASRFTFDALVDDIVALLDRLGQLKKPAYVAGISMGAALALRMALDSRLDTRGMALVRPAFTDTRCPPNLAVMAVVARLLQAHKVVDAKQALVESPQYRAIAAVSHAGAASVMDQLDKPHARERVIRLEAVPANVAYQSTDELAALSVPTVVVGAERDPMHPIEVARATARMIGPAELREVVPRDIDAARYNDEVRNAVQDHLQRVVPRRP